MLQGGGSQGSAAGDEGWGRNKGLLLSQFTGKVRPLLLQPVALTFHSPPSVLRAIARQPSGPQETTIRDSRKSASWKPGGPFASVQGDRQKRAGPSPGAFPSGREGEPRVPARSERSPEPRAPAAACASSGFSRLGRGGRGQRARGGRGPESKGPQSSTVLTQRNFPSPPRKRRPGGAGAAIAGLRGRGSSPRPCPKPARLHPSVGHRETAIDRGLPWLQPSPAR